MTTALNVEKGKYRDFADSFHDLRDKLTEEGYQVFVWQDAPGEYHMNHSHPNDELIVVSTGTIVFEIDNQRLELEAGDAMSLPANTVHSATNETQSPVCYFICTKTAT